MTAQIDITIECSGWLTALPDAERLAREAAAAALRAAVAAGDGELSVLLTGDETVRALNRDYRGKDRSTNVLAFEIGDAPAAPGEPRLLGDIVVACGTVCREAREQGKPLADHFRHLIVHGVLHLLGHDHIDDDEAAKMEAAETAILAAMGIGDPYARSDAATGDNKNEAVRARQ